MGTYLTEVTYLTQPHLDIFQTLPHPDYLPYPVPLAQLYPTLPKYQPTIFLVSWWEVVLGRIGTHPTYPCTFPYRTREPTLPYPSRIPSLSWLPTITYPTIPRQTLLYLKPTPHYPYTPQPALSYPTLLLGLIR